MATNRTITLYHATHEDNWFSVHERGLLVSAARSRQKSVWLVTRSKIAWAASHVCTTHHWTLDSIVVFEVTVRRSWLRKTSIRGVWRSVKDVTPDRIIESEVYL